MNWCRSLLAVMALSLTVYPAGAIGLKPGVCMLSADKSRVEVTAGNSSTKAYACATECRLRVSGQRAFELFKCQYRLGANAKEKLVCHRDGGSPGHYTEVATTSAICVPR